MADKTIITFGPKTSDILLTVAQRQGVNINPERAAGQWARIMFAKITGDWEQESSDQAYYAPACLVKWNGMTQSFDADENLKIPKLYDPLSGTEKPTHVVDDIVSIAYTGMYVIVGSPGGESSPTEEMIATTTSTITNTSPGFVNQLPDGSQLTSQVYGDMLTDYQVVPPGTRVMVGKVKTRIGVSTYDRWQLKTTANLSYFPYLPSPSITAGALADQKFPVTIANSTVNTVPENATLTVEILNYSVQGGNLVLSMFKRLTGQASPLNMSLNYQANIGNRTPYVQIRAYTEATNTGMNPQPPAIASLLAYRSVNNAQYVEP